MAKHELNKYNQDIQIGGLRGSMIELEEIKDINYTDEGEYRIFHKKCQKCNQEFKVNIPVKFFQETLPPEMDRNFILKQIKKEYCYNCEQESKNDQ